MSGECLPTVEKISLDSDFVMFQILLSVRFLLIFLLKRNLYISVRLETRNSLIFNSINLTIPSQLDKLLSVYIFFI